MSQDDDWYAAAGPLPEIPAPARYTATERGVWVVYGVVAAVLLAVPLLTHSLGLLDVAAWLLVVGAAALSTYWMRTGELRCPEWLLAEDYEEFLSELQGPDPEASPEPPPPTPPGQRAG
ncbi:MAG: hypothetical protein ACREOD_08845 [Candidatus Dormibacteria bacterium]